MIASLGFLVVCLLSVGMAQYGGNPTYQTPPPSQQFDQQNNNAWNRDIAAHNRAAGYPREPHQGHHHHDQHYQGHHHHDYHLQNADLHHQGGGFADGRNGLTQSNIGRRINDDYVDNVTPASRVLDVPRERQSFNALNARQILQHRGVAVSDIETRFGGDEELVQRVQPTSSFAKRPVASGLIL